jgi:hypothetical protein
MKIIKQTNYIKLKIHKHPLLEGACPPKEGTKGVGCSFKTKDFNT